MSCFFYCLFLINSVLEFIALYQAFSGFLKKLFDVLNNMFYNINELNFLYLVVQYKEIYVKLKLK
jgi:hypothetical protein